MILQLIENGATNSGGTYSLFWIEKSKSDGYYVLEIWRRTRNGRTKLFRVLSYVSGKYARERINRLK